MLASKAAPASWSKPGLASKLSINAPASVTPGVAFTFTVTALDAYGNVATGYIGTVQFSSSDAAASLPVNYTFTSSDAGICHLHRDHGYDGQRMVDSHRHPDAEHHRDLP